MIHSNEETIDRSRGLRRCLWVYLVALLCAVVAIRAFPGRSLLFRAGVADIVATLVVYLFSRLYGNSSLYDPYWSVAPPVLALYWLFAAGVALGGGALYLLRPGVPGAFRAAIVMVVVWWWAVRLTANWIRRWGGMGEEDWRYVELKSRAGSAGWLVDLFGIQLFPTVQVFVASLSIYVVMTRAITAPEPGLLDAVALVVTVAAVLLETTADRQLIRFRRDRNNEGELLDTGVWSVVRHPNYLGEILFWWGLWLFGMAAAPSSWWLIVGPLSMTALFVFISVPMMDRHMTNRYPGYGKHKDETPALLPWVF